MEEYGVPVRRVINAGGIPQRNEVLNRVYADVFGKPVLVPQSEVTSLGSAIFAFLAAGKFHSVEEAQDALCPKYRVIEPAPDSTAVYERLYQLYRRVYFALGRRGADLADAGDVLPSLREIAAEIRTGVNARATA
jgi:L-ribulokinase